MRSEKMESEINSNQNESTEWSQGDLMQFEDVTKIFKSGHVRNYALDKINLKIKVGESLAIVGESGSGKSTLGLVAVNLLRINSGRILFQGKDISKLRGAALRAFRRNTQMVFQDPYSSLNPYNTIYQSVISPVNANKLYYENLTGEKVDSRSQLRDRVAEMLDLVGLTPGQNFLDLFPKKLSGGQRQRVALARSLILRPKLIVADEPTSMLDVSISAQVLNLLTKLKKDLKFSIMYISHELGTSKYISEKMAVMNLGRIVEYGSSDEITQHPMHPYTDILIKSMLEVGGFRTEEPLAKIDFGQYNGGVKACTFAHSCPFVTDQCLNQRPELEQIDNDHWVACFHPISR